MGGLAPGQGSGEGSEEVLLRRDHGMQSTGWEETWPFQELTGGPSGQWVRSKVEPGGG